MNRWVWMNAWDLEGRDPRALIGELRGVGLTGCSLGLSYHGGRMLLARHAHRVVYEQPPGALYFAADTARFPSALRPEVAEQAGLVPEFLRECCRAGFDAQAWTVLCHNDALGAAAPECCVENAFGETYAYALCPANPVVQDYCAELCRQAAEVEGIGGVDLEALGWLGYEHQGLHEKRGLPLSREAAWWLSICCCPHCRAGCGDLRAPIRENVRAWLEDPRRPREAGFDEVVEWRARIQRTLLDRIRSAAPRARLNLRLALDPRFSGGKSTLDLGSAGALAGEATLTFFGASEARMKDDLATLPLERPVKLNGGFIFHGPDCASAADVSRRLDLLRRAKLDGWGFYGFGMAAGIHWEWLRQALKGESQ